MSLWAVEVKRSLTETVWVEASCRQAACQRAVEKNAKDHIADGFRAVSAKRMDADQPLGEQVHV